MHVKEAEVEVHEGVSRRSDVGGGTGGAGWSTLHAVQ